MRRAPWQEEAAAGLSAFRTGAVLGSYRLERQLGAGSFGEVWEATDRTIPRAPRRVALKILSVLGVPGGLLGLAREAEICRTLNHPNIIEVFGVQRDDDAAFVAMEFVPGPTLLQATGLLAARGLRMPRSALVEIGLGIARALAHAWDGLDAHGQPHHIAHRNLRPAEVMVSEGGVVKVGGFALAKIAEDPAQTSAGVLRGSPTYMPPERWRGVKAVTAAGDLYALGVILWELATGGRFLPKAGLPAMYAIVEGRSPAEEAAAAERVFPEIAPLLLGLLERDPARRTGTASEVIARLQEVRSRIVGEGTLEQFVWMLGRLPPSPEPAVSPAAEDEDDSLELAWDRLVTSAELSLAGDEAADGTATEPEIRAVGAAPLDPRAALAGPFWSDDEWGRADWSGWAPATWSQATPALPDGGADGEESLPEDAVTGPMVAVPGASPGPAAPPPSVALSSVAPPSAAGPPPGGPALGKRRRRTTPGEPAPGRRRTAPGVPVPQPAPGRRRTTPGVPVPQPPLARRRTPARGLAAVVVVVVLLAIALAALR